MYILNKQQQFKDSTLQNGILWQSTKNTDIFMFSFEWLKRVWRPQDCCLHSKFFTKELYRDQLWHLRLILCDALRDLIPFLQFKKLKKQPSRIITFNNAWKYNNIGIPSLFLSVKFFTIERFELTLLLISYFHE